jgi:deazaflavin-dependent oxidoreductase (nitroreductase family)
MGRTRWFGWLVGHLLSPVDRWVYRRSGHSGLTPREIPTLLLTTKGRTSGLERTVHVICVRDGDRLILTDANVGQAARPAWSANLLACPDARVQIGTQELECRARFATPEEQRRYWPELTSVWPPFAVYRSRLSREIRMFVLEPQHP